MEIEPGFSVRGSSLHLRFEPARRGRISAVRAIHEMHVVPRKRGGHDAGHQCGILLVQAVISASREAAGFQPGADFFEPCDVDVHRHFQTIVEFPEIGVAGD